MANFNPGDYDDFYNEEPSQEPPQKPPKKPMSTGAKVGIGCGIAALVVVLILFGMFGCTAIMVGTSTDNSSSSSNSEDENKVYGIGQTATIEGVDVTLNSVQSMTELPTAGFPTTAPDGSVYLVTDWKIVNNSDSEVAVTPENFQVYVDNQSTSTSGSSYMLDGALTSDLELASGRETSGTIVYEVPTGWQTFETEFEPNVVLDKSVKFEFTSADVK